MSIRGLSLPRLLRLGKRSRLNLALAAAANILIALVFLGLLLEGLLSLFDPWGMHYFDDLIVLQRGVRPDPVRGYRLEPGVYHFTHWTATQTTEGRLIPDKGTGCKVVFIGDSVTWGYGVDDSETWVNLLSRQLNLDATNSALTGYNSENVRRTIGQYPDATIVYLITDNDDEPTEGYSKPMQTMPSMSMIEKYGRLILARAQGKDGGPDAKEPGRFLSDIAILQQNPQVTMLAFDGEVGARPGVWTIPRYTQRISIMDAHANQAGNQEIAAAMLPIVREAVASCGGNH